MCKIFNKMEKKVVKGFPGLDVFLAAIGAESIFNYVIAIEASFIGTDGMV
jgi:hypothetical protein